MRYVYPPRPKGRTTPSDLNIFDSSGQWLVQRKYNGVRNLVHRMADGSIFFFNRHGKEQSKIRPTKSMVEAIKSIGFKDGREYVLDGELLKFENGSSILVIFDLLWDGKYLFGSPSQVDRLEILRGLWGKENFDCDYGCKLSEDLFLANYWTKGFAKEFDRVLGHSKIEGLVLRKRHSALDDYGYHEYETTSQVRCRKPVRNGLNF